MSETIRTYVADSQLAALLRAAAESGQRLKVIANGQTFEVEVSPASRNHDIWEGYDPEAAINAWDALRGSLNEIDPDELIRQIKEDCFCPCR